MIYVCRGPNWVGGITWLTLMLLNPGNAQRAYAALKAKDTKKCPEVKAAILRRYNITEETYRQRFRSDKRKDSESFMELVIRLQDLFQKWTAGCKTVEEVSEKMVIEQLLNTMPSDLRIWIKEKFVLVLLPTTTSKFTAQWQGPYQVSKVVGKVNYLVDMDDRKKRKRIFHVNIC